VTTGAQLARTSCHHSKVSASWLTDVSAAVSKFGKRECRKRNLGEWWQALVDEPLKPTQRRPLVAVRIEAPQQLTEQELIIERQSAHLPGGHLRRLKVSALDSALETAPCCALRRHDDCHWGDG
jgi:hypothetical protein